MDERKDGDENDGDDATSGAEMCRAWRGWKDVCRIPATCGKSETFMSCISLFMPCHACTHPIRPYRILVDLLIC